MKVKLIVEGGAMKPGPAVAQSLGPLGINIGKVISDVNVATTGFKGMNVPVEIDVDTKTKNYLISVSSPSVAELLKKELSLEKGSNSPLKIKVGNISFERVLSIAKTKHASLLAKDLRAAIKLIVGTCVSLGIMIDSKEAKDIEKDIDSGKYDSEIKDEIASPSEQKKKDLEEFFAVRKAKQDHELKLAEEAKAAAEAAKTAVTATSTAAGVAPTTNAVSPTPIAHGAKAQEAPKKEEKPAKKR